MSALEPGSIVQIERRRSPRLRIAGTIPAHIGRGEGVLLDVSERGAKIRHSTMVRSGATIRIGFEWERARFSASAEVLASRLVSLGDERTPAMYESRMRFLIVDAAASQMLARTIDAMVRPGVRRPSAQATPRTAAAFIRCGLTGMRWEVQCTASAVQPENGFVLPSALDDNEIVKLCADYLRADSDGRNAIRLQAATAVEQALAASDRQCLGRPA